MSSAPSALFLDGRLLRPDQSSNRGIHLNPFGQGIYETMRVRKGRASFAKKHFQRMLESAAHFGMGCPVDWNTFQDALDQLILAGKAQEGWIRAVLSLESPSTEHTVFWASAFPQIPYQNLPWEDGISVDFASFVRDPSDPSVGHKTLSSWNLHWTRKRARERGHFDSLLRNLHGHLTEGCVSNLFLLRGRELVTPPLSDGLLPGITRAFILEHSPAFGLECSEISIRKEDLEQCDQVFLSNSLIDIVTVGPSIPLIRRLRQELFETPLPT
ncbi:MAG: aminotransferase class IV [Planctomycetota bacterium]|nr:aminotransferase class IV [Planctomycetota bacterium]